MATGSAGCRRSGGRRRSSGSGAAGGLGEGADQVLVGSERRQLGEAVRGGVGGPGQRSEVQVSTKGENHDGSSSRVARTLTNQSSPSIRVKSQLMQYRQKRWRAAPCRPPITGSPAVTMLGRKGLGEEAVEAGEARGPPAERAQTGGVHDAGRRPLGAGRKRMQAAGAGPDAGEEVVAVEQEVGDVADAGRRGQREQDGGGEVGAVDLGGDPRRDRLRRAGSGRRDPAICAAGPP